MEESATRRQELLAQMRNSKEFQTIPPVHPKYRTAYSDMNVEKSSIHHGNSFLVRFTIAVIGFLCYVWMDTTDTKILEMGSADVAVKIETPMNLEEIKEVWKEL